MPADSPFTEGAIGGPGKWTDEQLARKPVLKEQILDLIASGLFLSEICQQLDMTPRTVRKWRMEDKVFDEQYTDAEAIVVDGLEKEAHRRAKNGVLEPVVSGGKLVMIQNDDGKLVPLEKRVYSDGLLMFLLKGKRREVFGDKREVDAKVGIDVTGAKASLEAKFAAAVSATGETT